MCGLLAGSGKLEARIITALGCLNDKRGSDSAGVAWLENGMVRLQKIAQHPLIAFPVTLQNAIRRAAVNRGAIIGHTRQATTGAINSANAHPFLEDGIAYAHNGVIINHKEIGTFEVDSQSLILGIKARDFSKYEGSIALTWIEGGKLHAYRKGNPLFRGVLRGAVYLASERGFLDGLGCQKVKELGEARIYVFNGAHVETTLSVPSNKTWTRRYTSGSSVSQTGGYCGTEFGSWPDNDTGADGLPDPKTADSLFRATNRPGDAMPQTSGTPPERVGSLERPTYRKVLKLIPEHRRPVGISYQEYMAGRNRARQNRLALDAGYEDSIDKEGEDMSEADAIAEAEAMAGLADVGPDELCQNCMNEPKLPAVDYGELCAIRYGLSEAKA